MRRLAWGAIRAGARLRDRVVERRYGLPRESAGVVWLRDEGYAGPERNSYAPAPWGSLRNALPVDEVSKHDVFLDIGCGMGRVMLEAGMRYPFARVEGVELVPRLAQAARALLTSNARRLRCGSWNVVTSDVVDYTVPDDVTVVFLYDPFTGALFDAVMGRLEASVARRPRRMRIVYVTPQESARMLRSGAVVRSGRFSPLRTGTVYRYLVCDLRHSRP